ncbi:S41 family peptidase [bacterium]|nr:S41 family peptidase [bacterium]
MTRRFRKTAPIITALIVGALIGGWAVERVGARSDLYTYLDLFNDALAKVEHVYVEEIDAKDLMYGAIRGMLSSLDPYSVFLDEESFSDFQVTTEGEFGGLGIQITVRDGILTVVSPIEGTPAYDLGIQSGDRIVAIEGESTRGITVDRAISKLRGKAGTDVDITIHREGLDDYLDYTVTRDIIRIDSVPYSFLMENDLGYVRISRFARTTAQELETSLDELDVQGMRGLVLDLRSNPGGLLSEAVDVSDVFLDAGELVVSTRGRVREQNKEFYASTPARYPRDFPIVVLINGGSASASEILAGAIQDWDRGIVAGTTSFGKGSVQTLMRLRPLTKECAVKLTTAKWYTSSGRLIEKPERWDTDEELADGDAEGEGEEEARPEFHTAAGRTVYGGGGVAPDVTIKSGRRSDIVVDLERRGEFFEFAIDYLAANEIDGADLTITGDMWDAFLAFLGDDGFEFSSEELVEHRDEIELSMRRDLARKLWGREKAYEIAIKGDTQLSGTVALAIQATNLAELFSLAEAHVEAEEPEDIEE